MSEDSNITASIKHMFACGYKAPERQDNLPKMEFIRKDKDYEFLASFDPFEDGPFEIYIKSSKGICYNIFDDKYNKDFCPEDASAKDILEHIKILLEIKRIKESGLPKR